MATREDLGIRVTKLKQALNIDLVKNRIAELERESQTPEFWQDHEKAAKLMSELSAKTSQVEEIARLEKMVEEGKIEESEKQLKNLEILTFLSGDYDKGGALLSIHAGQGGTEAMDWAEMLLRMFIRFSQKRGFGVREVDRTPGEEAGIKSATLIIGGPYAYGYLKGEAGNHRLVRQSPFNADHLRQTSFALVEVLPELPPQEKVEIRDEDLEWQFFRASSQGGQNVQKVSTAVRLTHKPTGITVTAQAERYQEQNRRNALSLLSAKLWARGEEKRKEEKKQLKGVYRPASWGTQIRSYVLHPYKLVKDLRTGVETSQVEKVLDGDLDEFIEEEVKWNSNG